MKILAISIIAVLFLVVYHADNVFAATATAPALKILTPNPYVLPSNVNFEVIVGNAMSTGSTIKSITWRVDDGPSSNAINDATFMRPAFSNWHLDTSALSNGKHTIYITATDSAGLTTTVQVQTTVSYIPPKQLILTITSPANGTKIIGAKFTMSGTTSGATASSLSWKIDKNPTIYKIAPPFSNWSFVVPPLAPGVHTITIIPGVPVGTARGPLVTLTVTR